MHWPELHELFHKNTNELSNDDRGQSVIDNPHIVDWFVTKRIESFIKHWLYDTLHATWHWYRYEFQARGSIHCHGTAKLEGDPGLCELSKIALKGFLAEKSLLANLLSDENVFETIEKGRLASNQICEYIDSILTTVNPQPPDSVSWTKPGIHPCKVRYEDIPDDKLDGDYVDLLNTVQR